MFREFGTEKVDAYAVCQLADILPHLPPTDRKSWIGRKQEMLKELQVCHCEIWQLIPYRLLN